MNIDADAHYILFQGNKVFCRPGAPWRLLRGAEVLQSGWRIVRSSPLLPNDASVGVLEVSDAPGAEDWRSLRELLMTVPEVDFRLIGMAAQVLEWSLNHRFCGRCGQPTTMAPLERAMHCPACGLSCYPRVSPCVIVLVTRGNEILLARSKRFTLPIYSCLAGFIEAGESAEDAVHREILEEANVRVKNLRYLYSQPWPFPHQLMLGYFAEYDSGDLRIDEQELADADWFAVDALPQVPPTQTIAGQLIRSYVQEYLASL